MMLILSARPNSRIILVCAIIASIFLITGHVYAGWSEDVRLTNRGYEILPQVIARGDTVHVAWQQIATDMFVSYMRSTNGGDSWDSLFNLTESGHQGTNIDLMLSGNKIFVGWDDENTNLPNWVANIAYTASPYGGAWPRPNYVYPDTMRNHPSYDGGIINHLDSIYVVYNATWEDSIDNPIIFLYSSDFGQTWSQEVTVGHTYNYTNPLQIAKCGRTLYIVWSGDNPPTIFNRRVIATASRDGGQSWSEPFLISSNEHTAQHSCVACDEETGYFAVGWMDFTFSGGFPGDLFVRLTTDGGISWGDIHYATSHHKVSDPQIDIRGDSLWAVWSDRDTAYGHLNSEICFSRTTDVGFSWTPYNRLTYAEGRSYTPWISYDNGKLHVVWEDDRDGEDIYYKRYDPDPIGIDEHGNIPKGVSLSAYPNPFNSSVLISYSFENAKGGDLKIYDIQGQLVNSLTIMGREGKITWDARSLPSGVYFARLEAKANTTIKKMVLLK
jgi:hypothetical protein